MLIGILLAWSFLDAFRSGPLRVARLLSALAYGLLLEIATVRLFEYYTYLPTQFRLIAGGVPVVIGMGWAVIIYAAMRATDGVQAGALPRALIDTALALTLDLAMDPVAVHLGFWTWTPPGPWWGVPLYNFYGWAIVVTGFSAFSRWLEGWLPAAFPAPGGAPSWRRWIPPVLALPLSLLFLQVALKVGDALPPLFHEVITALLYLAGLVLALRMLCLKQAIERAVPLAITLFFVTAYLLDGMFAALPGLLLLLLLALGLFLFWSYRADRQP